MDKRRIRTWQILDEYEKRFSSIRSKKRLREPWLQNDRNEILQNVKEILAFDKISSPKIEIIAENRELCRGIKVNHCTYRSWDNFYGTFSLYTPKGEGKRPLIFVCPGHAKDGRLSEFNQKMSLRLCELGAYVICNDNIGQGSRSAFGHWKSIAPFYCGITLQGMIVKETLALIDYARSLPYVDIEHIGACGNSGGGTLTAFLAALDQSLAAVASCGYPSEFHYVFEKEREHCACNILPGAVRSLEMWELYSLRAPKPLLLEQGIYDDLFPVEYFMRNARKLDSVWRIMGKGENFKYETTDTKHPWRECDVELMSEYFKEQFALSGEISESDAVMEVRRSDYPNDAISTDELAQRLTGINMPIGTRLEDIFIPKHQGEKIDPSSIEEDLGRGSLMRVLAQFEAVLN